MKLRLLLWSECNRACPGCCNKQWNLDALPVCCDLTGFEEVILTGGEPMLNPSAIHRVVAQVPSHVPVIVYTAKVDDLAEVLDLLTVVEGLTVTLHEQADVDPFLSLLAATRTWRHKSLRLNVFRGVQLPSNFDPGAWRVKADIVWIENCPLPTDEVFMRAGDLLWKS